MLAALLVLEAGREQVTNSKVAKVSHKVVYKLVFEGICRCYGGGCNMIPCLIVSGEQSFGSMLTKTEDYEKTEIHRGSF